jgi:leucyl/phenylalanyl-tRNA--protein transferase
MVKLEPQLLLSAYCQGIFPMADHTGTIRWYDPDPRAIIPLDDSFHVPARLARTIRNGPFTIRANTSFRQVIEACGDPAPGREETWISPIIVDAYCALHAAGFAHSVETWQGEELVGGLYGVGVRGLFAGESMFSRATDASKVALVALVNLLRQGGFVLLDTQFTTPHLERFGATEIPRALYRRHLAAALLVEAHFGRG